MRHETGQSFEPCESLQAWHLIVRTQLDRSLQCVGRGSTKHGPQQPETGFAQDQKKTSDAGIHRYFFSERNATPTANPCNLGSPPGRVPGSFATAAGGGGGLPNPQVDKAQNSMALKLVCLSACLLACLPACLPACLLACLPACLLLFLACFSTCVVLLKN